MSAKTTTGNTIRRIIGLALLVIGVLGVVLSIAGIVIGGRVIDGVGAVAKDALVLAANGLNTTKGTLEQTKATIQGVQAGLGNVETAIVDAGQTVSQSDALVEQALRITSRDIPDTLDAVNAALPGAAKTAQSLLSNVEAAMVTTSQTVDRNGPLVNQALKIVSQNVPDALDQVNANVPPLAETAQAFLNNIEMIMVDASKTVGQADAAYSQVVRFASRDVPDTLDIVNAAIPPAAATAKNLLANTESAMVDASVMIDQADVTMDQVVYITTRDVPNILDTVNAAVPPAVETAKTVLSNTEAVMANTSQMISQADATVDQAMRVTGQDIPNALDVLNAAIPVTGDAAHALVASVDLTLQGASATVDQTQAALDVTSQILSRQVPDTLDQVNATLPSLMQATEANVNTTLALLKEMNYVDRNYRVQIDEPAAQLSTNLGSLSKQLRSMDRLFKTDLDVVDQGISATSKNLEQINAQIDQFVAMGSQLDQVSKQLRLLGTLYDQSIDLQAVSKDIMTTSQSVGAINDQVDQLMVMADQLEQISGQLRTLERLYNDNIDLGMVSKNVLTLSQSLGALNGQIDAFVQVAGQLGVLSNQLRAFEPYADLGVGRVSQDIMALSKNVAAVNGQVDEFVKIADQVDVLSDQLRALEPYAEVDYQTISRNILALSQDASAINGQIDELVKLAGQMQVLSSQLRTLEPYTQVDFQTIGQDVVKLSENVAGINQQMDGFVALVDQYIGLVDNTNNALNQVQAGLSRQLALAKLVIVIAMIWILLGQLAPLYLGWELISGRRDVLSPTE